MISLTALLVLLIAVCFLPRGESAVGWKVALGIVGTLAACKLVVVLAVVLAFAGGWHPDFWIDLEQQIDYVLAEKHVTSASPARPAEVKESVISPIDLSDEQPAPALYAAQRAEIERQWHDAELERRLWHAGSAAGGLFAIVAIAAAYLKLDLHTSGRHRTRLRLAAASALALTTAAAAWAWTQPL